MYKTTLDFLFFGDCVVFIFGCFDIEAYLALVAPGWDNQMHAHTAFDKHICVLYTCKLILYHYSHYYSHGSSTDLFVVRLRKIK